MSPRALAKNAIALAITLVNRVVPKKDAVLIGGFPRDEPGILEVARALSMAGVPMTWVNAPRDELLEHARIDPQLVRRSDEWSWGGVSGFLRARTVIFSHGLFGVPAPARGQRIVNLWHGELVKGGGGLFPDRWNLIGPASNVVVGGSGVLTPEKARRSRLSQGEFEYVFSGNPCADALTRRLPSNALEALSIDPTRPWVVWMPTFRRAKDAKGRIAWSNTASAEADDDLLDEMKEIVRLLLESGVGVVIKPHPLDYATRNIDGAISLTNEELELAGVPLYELLGSSAGLITDFSSVWVDYLGIDRPIAFFAPDIEAYRSGRGLNPVVDFMLSACELRSGHAEVGRFAQDVLDAGRNSAEMRREARRRLRVVPCDGLATKRSLYELDLTDGLALLSQDRQAKR